MSNKLQPQLYYIIFQMLLVKVIKIIIFPFYLFKKQKNIILFHSLILLFSVFSLFSYLFISFIFITLLSLLSLLSLVEYILSNYFSVNYFIYSVYFYKSSYGHFIVSYVP